MTEQPFCILTFDVEEWFHRVDVNIPSDAVSGTEGRVIKNILTIIDILKGTRTRATFFVLGSLAERFPEIVSYIKAGGYEVASHGYIHKPVYERTANEFRDDIRRSKTVLEAQLGAPIIGYRAPAWSIPPSAEWAWNALTEEGFKYDSSLASKSFAPRKSEANIQGWFKLKNGLTEIPPSHINIAGINVPLGGFVLRALPYPFLIRKARKLWRNNIVPVIYLHPWEVDAEFSYPSSIPLKARLLLTAKRVGIKNCGDKLQRFLKIFPAKTMKEFLKDKI